MTSPRSGSALLLLGLLSLQGCAIGTPSEQTRFYRLQTPPPVIPNAENRKSPPLAILPVHLPVYLDRVSLVVQVTPVRVDIPQLEQWAGNLREDVQLALLGHLSRELNNPNLRLTGNAGTGPGKTLQVDILRFDGEMNKQATLSASWTLHDRNSGQQRQGQFLGTEPVQPGYEGLVEGMSKLVAQLAQAIAPAAR